MPTHNSTSNNLICTKTLGFGSPYLIFCVVLRFSKFIPHSTLKFSQPTVQKNTRPLQLILGTNCDSSYQDSYSPLPDGTFLPHLPSHQYGSNHDIPPHHRPVLLNGEAPAHVHRLTLPDKNIAYYQKCISHHNHRTHLTVRF